MSTYIRSSRQNPPSKAGLIYKHRLEKNNIIYLEPVSSLPKYMYSKDCLKWPLKNRQKQRS